MVLNFENDLTEKYAHHVNYDVYQHIFFFSVITTNKPLCPEEWPDLSFLSVKKRTEFLTNILY